MDKKSFLSLIGEKMNPEVVAKMQSFLPDDFQLSDNQNQNQGNMEEISKMKPEILRQIGSGVDFGGDEVMDNQNQNQGKMEDLLRMKPAALQSLKTVLMGGGEEVMDNQNQNQGTQAGALARGLDKPGK